MPIISHNPAPPPPKPQIDVTPKVMSDTYQSCIVDLKDPEVANLSTMLSGYQLKTDYYSQVLGLNDAPTVYDYTQNAVYQQYQRIRNLVVFMDGALSQSASPESTEFTIEGSGSLMAGLIPNVGDVLVFDLGNGHMAVASVTSVERLSYFKQAAHKIQIKVTRYLTDLIQANLDSKVVKEFVFDLNNIALGQQPIITPEADQENRTLQSLLDELILRFSTEFYSPELNTYLVGGCTLPTYDPFALRAWFKLVPFDANDITRKAQPLNCSDFELPRIQSVWDALMEGSPALMDLMFSKSGVFSVSQFNARPLLRSVRFSQARFVIVPDPEGFGKHPVPLKYPVPESYSAILLDTELAGDHYVFSEAFYAKNAALMTARDKAAYNAIIGVSNPLATLTSLYDNAGRAEPYIRFYDYLLLIILTTRELRCG